MRVVNSNYIFDPYWSSCGIIYFRWLIDLFYNNLRPAWKNANESWYVNSKQAICPTMLNCISRLKYRIQLNGTLDLYQCKVGPETNRGTYLELFEYSHKQKEMNKYKNMIISDEIRDTIQIWLKYDKHNLTYWNCMNTHILYVNMYEYNSIYPFVIKHWDLSARLIKTSSNVLSLEARSIRSKQLWARTCLTMIWLMTQLQ